MSTFAARVDAREYPPRDKHTVIFNTYLNLKSGEKMELVNDHDPKPLYYHFQAEFNGQFEWNYLEEGPQIWRVSIEKK
jgi:uncharacterized protein (DUF2249 family)